MSENFRTVVVVNPASAGGKAGKQWPETSALLHAQFGAFDEARTAAPGDATTLTREAIRGGAEMVVALGGDGTTNEVVNGFFEEAGGPAVNPDAVLGLLPFGTGGDFRKTLGLGLDLTENVQRLRGRESRQIDVGRMTCVGHDGQELVRHFINIASFGMSGDVDARVNRSRKTLGGKLTFMVATVRSLLSFDNVRIRLTLDDREPFERLCNTVSVANGKWFGGGMKVAPNAEPDDGIFDLIGFGDVGIGWFATKQGLLYKGEHLDDSRVFSDRAARVRAESVEEREVLIDLDGEQPGRLPATFDVLPGAIRVHT
jgi:YegS/Rv2252/BmrU family lipid kinase